MEVTWFGNATVRYDDGDGGVLLDPFRTRNPKLPTFDSDDYQGIKAILITHGHFDHITGVPTVARELDVPVYCPGPVRDTLVDVLEMDPDRIEVLEPKQSITEADLLVKPYEAEHIVFEWGFLLRKLSKTLTSGQILRYGPNLVRCLNDHRRMPEGQCYAWYIEGDEVSVLHFGSLAFDPSESYPDQVDLLSLPFQGSDKLDQIGMEFVKKFNPSEIVLQHFDDAFPPISSNVSTQIFEMRASNYDSNTRVYRPDYGASMEVS